MGFPIIELEEVGISEYCQQLELSLACFWLEYTSSSQDKVFRVKHHILPSQYTRI